MYLKSLEIQGFKSFPEKTRLTFEKDITAIVGPNGSGKSNISDAILWVMGEQRTRALRGGKMEDVVFGGTERRSAMGYAQVTLVLDNSDGRFQLDSPEIMLTRRYYRGGESEYYINKDSVRLKDINELLMDTGLGREGYSIISQGRIAEIVSVKSTDRRQIFEEAAGISRFRHRKEESERKLQRTEENLMRIRDKIDELELQVEPLRQQAEVAKRYLVFRDELRLLEISVWMENLDEVRRQSTGIEADYAAAKANLDEAGRQLEALYTTAEQIFEEIRSQDLEAEHTRESLRQTEAAAAECESAAAVLRANRRNNAESLTRLQEEIEEQAGRAKGLEEQIAVQEARMQGIAVELEVLAREGQELQRQAEENAAAAGAAQAGVTECMGQEVAAGEALAEHRTMLAMLADKAQELLDRETGIQSDRQTAREKAEQAEAALRAEEMRLTTARERTEELKNMIAGHQQRRNGREAKVRELTERRTRQTIDLGALDSRIQMLTEMEKEYEGFSKAVKTVMREAERGGLRGIHGPVANLVKAEDRYALAIETALGGALQNIVVDHAEHGKSAIEMLKRRDAGRCTFLPLSSIRGGGLKQRPEGEDGYLGVAAELCCYAGAYETLFSNLLGRTVIAETLADAVRLGKKYSHAFRIVSLDGQVVNAGGSMTGGSTARGTGFLSRANECKRLQAQREKLAAEAERTQEALEQAQRELAAADYEMETAAAEQAEARDSLLKQEAAVNQWRVLLENAQASQAAMEEEVESLSAHMAGNRQRIEETRDKITALERELECLREEIRNKTAGRAALEEIRAGLHAQLAEKREAMASLETEREVTNRAAEQLRSLRQDLSGDRDSRESAMDAIRDRDQALETEMIQLQARLTEFRRQAEEYQTRLTEFTRLRLELEGRRVQAERAGQEQNRSLLDLERICARYEQKKLAADLEEKQLLDKLWDSYGLSHSVAQAIRQPVENLSQSNRRIGELKRDISALGTPNLGAIEEFERVNTRYGFLTEQRDDVEKAKRELLKLIGDITREMQEIFTREFKAIDDCFRSTFTELFGGGRAALVLEDEENVLDCGIEIKAQPPGKALSTISLMSGGEMAFVAIALYFAILKVRPTPFCVMDEIEAALDEANVIRYAEYMRTMSDKTQFIVITHRRGTMEEADLLYGVTMQEKGISRVISVDLDEAEETLKS